MPRRYKDVAECRPEIREYIENLKSGTDNADPELRNSGSTSRYLQDLRWYDHWLDEAEIDSVLDVSSSDANKVGVTLANEFNGTTPLFRWDRIYSFHDWIARMEYRSDNPFEKWNDDKDTQFGLTKSTEQSRHIEDDERYAPNQSEIRAMEENVGQHRNRNQLIIRLLWQTGMRRGEASGLLISDVDRDAREITIRAEIAKNDEKRVVAFQPSLDGLLSEWLDYGHREEMSAGTDHNRLFVGERGAPLSDDQINEIIINAADDAGLNELIYADANAPVGEDGDKVPNRWKISAHNIRHGYGTHMVHETDAGLWEVSKQMGHYSVEITEDIYVEEDPRAGLEDAHKFGPD